MHTLYPAIKPYTTHRLQVDEIHDIYIEECGSPEGIPILFVHGGPGSGCNEKDRRFFDPEKYRIILFDQRGSGLSKPYAEIENNTTDSLVPDIETIRAHLKIDKWILFGCSWGATLSLAYAIKYSRTVICMVLQGIFLARNRDVNWFYRNGANRIFPDNWQQFVQLIPEIEQENIVDAYHQRLFGDDEVARMNAAKHWSIWKVSALTLKPNQELIDHFSNSHHALALARIECNYIKHNFWLDKQPILSSIKEITNIPSIIIHGRYDMVCPLDNAVTLANQWQTAELHIIREAGHSPFEPSNTDALIRATDQFGQQFANPAK